ncbi:MAG: hypothetical protein KDE26_16955 [Bacteroidetes bacterium]|nr:hypothetical protein [Bacteroidota bacterium]
MKYSDNLEDLIKQALETEHEETVKSYDDMNLWEQSLSVFKGKHKLAPIANYIAIWVYAMGVFYSFYKVMTAEDTIFWLIVLNITLMAVAFNKIWHWMEINRKATKNEIKLLRLEIKSLLENKHQS